MRKGNKLMRNVRNIMLEYSYVCFLGCMCFFSLYSIVLMLLKIKHFDCLHVVGYIDWVKLISKKTVTKMHPLLLSTRVDRNYSWIDYHDNANNNVMLFQNTVGHHWHKIKSFVLSSVQFHHYNQQI